MSENSRPSKSHRDRFVSPSVRFGTKRLRDAVVLAAFALSACDADSNDDGAGPEVTSVTRSDSKISITLSEAVSGSWDAYCKLGPVLLKQEGGEWVPLAETPRCNTPYFLDGTYYSNECGTRCDGGQGCGALETLELSTLEYVEDGSLPGEGGAGGAINVPSFVTKETEGPYMLELEYFTSCAGVRQSVRLPVDVK